MRDITHSPTTTAEAVDHNRHQLEVERNCAWHRVDSEALGPGDAAPRGSGAGATPRSARRLGTEGTVPVWFGIATPVFSGHATVGETPILTWGIGPSLVMSPAFNLVPVSARSEVVAVSRVEWSSIEGSMAPPLAAIPLRDALARHFRRAQ